MNASLKQLGKSRADLWQFGGLIALERALERANRACDLDYWARQQVTLLEGREACEFKIHSFLKFKSGRADCVSEDKDGSGFKASKEELQPRMMGDARHTTDYFMEQFNMDPEHSQALQAVHGAVHQAEVGTKYTWFGPGYISNMYYKWIANHPRYDNDHGGDITLDGQVVMRAKGDTNGQPRRQTGWRASCMMMWNTTEGGPCFLRPTPSAAFDSPDPEHNTLECVDGIDEHWNPIIRDSRWCVNATAGEKNIIYGAAYGGRLGQCEGPFSDVDEDGELGFLVHANLSCITLQIWMKDTQDMALDGVTCLLFLGRFPHIGTSQQRMEDVV